jgi:hypothetical protein
MPASPHVKTPKRANIVKQSVKAKKDGLNGHTHEGPAEADPEHDYHEIQSNEIEALKSIYMDEYEHVKREGAWNVRKSATNGNTLQ